MRCSGCEYKVRIRFRKMEAPAPRNPQFGVRPGVGAFGRLRSAAVGGAVSIFNFPFSIFNPPRAAACGGGASGARCGPPPPEAAARAADAIMVEDRARKRRLAEPAARSRSRAKGCSLLSRPFAGYGLPQQRRPGRQREIVRDMGGASRAGRSHARRRPAILDRICGLRWLPPEGAAPRHLPNIRSALAVVAAATWSGASPFSSAIFSHTSRT